MKISVGDITDMYVNPFSFLIKLLQLLLIFSLQATISSLFKHTVTVQCELTKCHNGGTCVTSPSGNVCQCSPYFVGVLCQLANVCASNPCMNNATCIRTINGYKCECEEDFGGTRCQYALSNPCLSQPCLNNGTCINHSYAYFTCLCPALCSDSSTCRRCK